MVNEPIKLKDNLYLYSGDVITVNNSKPLLIEIVNDQDQIVKLRSIKKNTVFPKNNYLSRDKIKFYDKSALDFSTDFKNALTFTVKKNDDDKISLQADNEYLEINNEKKKFYLSTKEEWLTIKKEENIKDIAEYKEEITTINYHKDREKKISTEKVLTTTPECYDNSSKNVIEYSFEFTESTQEEHSFTWSTDFTWGVSGGLKLDCSSIAGLEVGGTFEKKSGTSKTITRTNIKENKKTLNISCSPQKRTLVKLEATKVKLLTPYTAIVKRNIGKRVYEYLIAGEYTHDSYSEFSPSIKEIIVKNILIVGWTGSGKSTLANVLSNSKDFVESDKSTPETKWGKRSKEFEWKENYYRVIDNIGFGDTEVSEKEELIRIGEKISEVSQGLSHVLFVYKRRFSDKEKEAFGKLNALKITNHFITVVRSNFDNFESKEKCKEDSELLKKESSEIKEVLNNCRGLLYVNNDEDEDRNTSREIVLNHLHDSCEGNPLTQEEWKKIEDIKILIEGYFAKRKELEDQADEIQKGEIKQQLNSLESDVKEKIQENEVYQLAQIIQETNK